MPPQPDGSSPSRSGTFSDCSSTMADAQVELTQTVPPKEPLAEIEREDDIEDEETKKKRERERSLWTKIWQGLAAASIAMNIAAMVIYGSGVAISMGVIACIVGPIVIKRQMDLQDTDSEWRVLCLEVWVPTVCAHIQCLRSYSTSTCPKRVETRSEQAPA